MVFLKLNCEKYLTFLNDEMTELYAFSKLFDLLSIKDLSSFRATNKYFHKLINSYAAVKKVMPYCIPGCFSGGNVTWKFCKSGILYCDKHHVIKSCVCEKHTCGEMNNFNNCEKYYCLKCYENKIKEYNICIKCHHHIIQCCRHGLKCDCGNFMCVNCAYNLFDTSPHEIDYGVVFVDIKYKILICHECYVGEPYKKIKLGNTIEKNISTGAFTF